MTLVSSMISVLNVLNLQHLQCFESSTHQQNVYESKLSDVNEDIDTSYAKEIHRSESVF